MSGGGWAEEIFRAIIFLKYYHKIHPGWVCKPTLNCGCEFRDYEV